MSKFSKEIIEQLEEKETAQEVPVQEQLNKIVNIKFSEIKDKIFSDLSKNKTIW